MLFVGEVDEAEIRKHDDRKDFVVSIQIHVRRKRGDYIRCFAKLDFVLMWLME